MMVAKYSAGIALVYQITKVGSMKLPHCMRLQPERCEKCLFPSALYPDTISSNKDCIIPVCLFVLHFRKKKKLRGRHFQQTSVLLDSFLD